MAEPFYCPRCEAELDEPVWSLIDTDVLTLVDHVLDNPDAWPRDLVEVARNISNVASVSSGVDLSDKYQEWLDDRIASVPKQVTDYLSGGPK